MGIVVILSPIRAQLTYMTVSRKLNIVIISVPRRREDEPRQQRKLNDILSF